MARGRVPGKSKVVEEVSEESSKVESAGPPTKKSKSNEDAVQASAGRKLVKISIEHCTAVLILNISPALYCSVVHCTAGLV